MVSDCIDERSGYLSLTRGEYDRAKASNPHIWMLARVLLEYGEIRKGYWMSDQFVKQVMKAVEIAEEFPSAVGREIMMIKLP